MKKISEKVSYLKGLFEGLKIDETADDGKIFKGILDVLGEISNSIEDLQDEQVELKEYIGEVDEDLGFLEEEYFEGEYEDEYDEDFYRVECPKCGEMIYLEDDEMFEDEITCPNCGEKISIDCCDCCEHD